MRALVRADASLAIGSGHITRCLTLANTLRSQGAEVVFACRELPGHLLERLREQGFSAYGLPGHYPDEALEADIESLLPWQADIDAMATALAAEAAFDWLIVDHYALDAHWQTLARRFAPRLMAIDDLANRRHAVDLLLDQNFSGTAQAYAPWIDKRCRTLLGPHYALMREAFQCEPVAIKPSVRRVIVNFGGFDAVGQTYEAMKAMTNFPRLEVDFVAGLGNPAWATMQALAEGRSNWRLQTHVSDFAPLMAEADLFIGAGGGTTWERAAFGLPTICVAVAANQQRNAELLAEAGMHLYLGTSQQVSVERFQQAIGLLVDNPWLRHSFARQSRQLVDGRGAQRVAEALLARP
jgi:UDP-2,4-diacetamido-2,4,6-trideoxy-beta-L-altropyranose hydrolase